MKKKWICPDCGTLNNKASQIYYTEGTVLHIAQDTFMLFCYYCCSTNFYHSSQIVEKIELDEDENKVKILPILLNSIRPKKNITNRIQSLQNFVE